MFDLFSHYCAVKMQHHDELRLLVNISETEEESMYQCYCFPISIAESCLEGFREDLKQQIQNEETVDRLKFYWLQPTR